MTDFLEFPFPAEDFKAIVKKGLSQKQKQLPPKFFYDRRGSEIFEEIVNLDEYYIPEAELEIYAHHGSEIAKQIKEKPLAIVELGSGSSEKIRQLIHELPQLKFYIPVDISKDFLKENALQFAKDYPQIDVIGIAADYTNDWSLPQRVIEQKLHILFYFPGSTVGNLSPEAAIALLKKMKEMMGAQGQLLVGADRDKDRSILETAYNDPQGVTARFNLNILRRIKNELGAELDLDGFEHRAVFNPAYSRIEMHLVSRRAQSITLDGESFAFEKGESICTEYSHKYSPENFSRLVEQAGLQVQSFWTDSRDYFAVYLLSPQSE